MKISILTISFNSVGTIEETIRSVINQESIDLEYITVDGNSTDGTKEIINKYKSDINRSIFGRDDGIYDAMNKGLNLVTGDIVGILNSDDLYSSESVLHEVTEIFRERPEIDVVYGDIEFFQDVTSNVRRSWVAGERKSFSKGWHPPHPALFVRNEVYKEYGFFKEEFKIAGDFEFMLRIFEKHQLKSYYIPKTLVKMRIGGISTKSPIAWITGFREVHRSFMLNEIKFPILLPIYRYWPKLKSLLFRDGS